MLSPLVCQASEADAAQPAADRNGGQPDKGDAADKATPPAVAGAAPEAPGQVADGVQEAEPMDIDQELQQDEQGAGPVHKEKRVGGEPTVCGAAAAAAADPCAHGGPPREGVGSTAASGGGATAARGPGGGAPVNGEEGEAEPTEQRGVGAVGVEGEEQQEQGAVEVEEPDPQAGALDSVPLEAIRLATGELALRCKEEERRRVAGLAEGAPKVLFWGGRAGRRDGMSMLHCRAPSPSPPSLSPPTPQTHTHTQSHAHAHHHHCRKDRGPGEASCPLNPAS